MMNSKPVKPDESECCGSGCKPCIFDVYEERLKKWEKNNFDFVPSKALNQIKYLPFLVSDIKNISGLLKILKFQAVTLKIKNHNGILIKNAKLNIDYEILNALLKIKAGEYLILKGTGTENDNSVVFSRSYTPILNDDFLNGSFTIIISIVADGKMSQFFTKIKSGDIVFWRGPFQELSPNFKSYERVVLIGGGTGAVPIYNIAKTIVDSEEEIWINVLCSYKTTEFILLRNEFLLLKDFWNFNMNIYISDQNPIDFKSNHNENIIFSKLNDSVMREELLKYKDEKVFFVVCGPQGFNRFVKNNLTELEIKNDNIFIFW